MKEIEVLLALHVDDSTAMSTEFYHSDERQSFEVLVSVLSLNDEGIKVA